MWRFPKRPCGCVGTILLIILGFLLSYILPPSVLVVILSLAVLFLGLSCLIR